MCIADLKSLVDNLVFFVTEGLEENLESNIGPNPDFEEPKPTKKKTDIYYLQADGIRPSSPRLTPRPKPKGYFPSEENYQ